MKNKSVWILFLLVILLACMYFTSNRASIYAMKAEYYFRKNNIFKIFLLQNTFKIMRDFKNGHVNILVATDIVSRGIDIDDIRLVINYDVPNDCEDYVHRIGRTARANNDGCAITFVNEKEQTHFKTIEDFLEKPTYKIPVPDELGESPAYEPKKSSNKSSKKRYTGKGKKQGGSRQRH